MRDNSIIPLLTEAERCIAAAIKRFDLKVKPEQICLTVQSKGRKQAVGWFGPERWKVAHKGAKASTVHEINMSAEHLQDYHMGELLIHELAHAENNALGIVDCSSNRMHNKHFKTMAERLGLEVKPRDKSVGYGYTDLGDGAKKFLTAIAFKRELFKQHRAASSGAKRGAVGSRLLKCECSECGYVCRTTKKWLDEVGAPHCPDHGEMEVA